MRQRSGWRGCSRRIRGGQGRRRAVKHLKRPVVLLLLLLQDAIFQVRVLIGVIVGV